MLPCFIPIAATFASFSSPFHLPSDLLEIPLACDADDDRGKDQRRDDAFDQTDEDAAEGLERDADVGKYPPDEKADAHADEDLLRKNEFGDLHVNACERVRVCGRG
jgi:hypothetical protein